MGGAIANKTTQAQNICTICNLYPESICCDKDLKICSICISKIQKNAAENVCLICKRQATFQLGCGHKVCHDHRALDCYYCKFLCTYCKRENINSNSLICRVHRFCNSCYKAHIKRVNKCLTCSGDLTLISCISCRKFDSDRMSLCKEPSHIICSACLNFGLSACTICKPCAGCDQIVKKYEKMDCEHFFCTTCSDSGVLCKTCKNKCQNCDKIVDGTKKFSCGHLACQNCLQSFPCNVCATCCNMCNVSFYDMTESDCGHYICDVCLENLGGYCPLCTNCTRCSKFGKCDIGECGHLLCKDCQNISTCMDCERLANICFCRKCGQETSFTSKFSCMEHFACQGCLARSNCTICYQKCSYCSNEALKCTELECGHFFCGECKGGEISECLACEKCSVCGKRGRSSPASCGHLICNLCKPSNAKCEECRLRIDKKCCVCCKTFRNSSNNYPCGHAACDDCFGSFYCSICRKLEYLITPIAICSSEGCSLDADAVCTINNKVFHYCKNHYRAEFNGSSPYYRVNSDDEERKNIITEKINKTIEVCNTLNSNIAKLAGEAVKNINESAANIIKLIKNNIQNLVKVKSKLVCDGIIYAENYENLSKRFKPYLFTNEIKFNSLLKDLCDFISEELITDSLEDKYYIYFSPKNKSLLSISLDKLRINPITSEDVLIGYQNQVTKIDTTLYFMNGGLNQGRLNDSYLINPTKKELVKIENSFVSMIGGACISVFPEVYLFGGNPQHASAYNIIEKFWKKLTNVPYSFLGGSSSLINKDMLFTGKGIDMVINYIRSSDQYTTIPCISDNNKILLDEYLLVNGLGIYTITLRDNEPTIVACCYDCEIGESVLIASYSVRRQDYFYFMNVDEQLKRFDTRKLIVENI